MKKISVLLLVFISALILVACNDVKKVMYTVTFDSQGGTEVALKKVEEGDYVEEPTTPILDLYTFVYWYLDDEAKAFEFKEIPITKDIVLKAFWTKTENEADVVKTDIEKVKQSLVTSNQLLNLPSRGEGGSMITWSIQSDYISASGVVLPQRKDGSVSTGIVEGTFKLGKTTVKESFVVDIPAFEEVLIDSKKEIAFKNLTTEYEMADATTQLLFAKDGTVPYIKVVDFFKLLKGFIDPNIQIDFLTEDGKLTISYDYYSEEEDYTYHLVCVIDTTENTITTTDPGFYSAYVYSTATNYGRHINYLDHLDESYEEGSELVFDLGRYNLDVILYENEVVLPFAIVNQLFAGSSYYNVYYNYDGLWGIYSLPGRDTDEFKNIRNSSQNGKLVSSDMLITTYNTLAFNLDYFYGLKDIKGIDTYYDVLSLYRDGLLNKSASSFDNTLFNIINKKIDELHTSYGYEGFYNTKSARGPQLTSLGQLGINVSAWYQEGLFAMQDAIDAKFGSESKRPDYWFLDNEHAVLSLDSFDTADITEYLVFNMEAVDQILKKEQVIPSIEEGSKFFFYNNSTQTNQVAGILVKNVTDLYIESYIDQMIALGFVKTKDNYYERHIDGKVFTVYIMYNPKNHTLTLEIADAAYDKASKELLIGSAYGLIDLDSAVYMEIMLEEMLGEKASIKSITLDIAYNTGGNVGALYRVVGFMTDKAFRVTSMNAATGSKSSSYIQIEGLENYSHLKWSLLVSPVTFSAANSLTTIFKENQLGAIIGTTTGGGTASITPILLPNGTAFTMSSNNLNGLRIGNQEDGYTYYDNESGIVPDYILAVKDIYQDIKILEFIDSYQAMKNSIYNNEQSGIAAFR